MDPFVGEIKLVPYNFAPVGWAFCAGQLLPISQNTPLFALIGTFYGGNGTSNFALPNLMGRSIIGPGQGLGLSDHVLGEMDGEQVVGLQVSQIPFHNHLVGVSTDLADHSGPLSVVPARAPLALGNAYGVGTPVEMASTSVAATGQSQPHQNLQPYLVLNYIIALEGIFPQRP